MASSRTFILFVLLFGFMLFVIFPSDKTDTSVQKREEWIRWQQTSRLQHLREECGEVERADSGQRRSVDDLKEEELSNFIVDDTNGIIYCFIPKVACTNWKRVMFALRQGEPFPDPKSIQSHYVHHPSNFSFIKTLPRPEATARLKHYTKFLFVRDPFVRLISAYRDKFQRFNAYFYEKYGREILRRYAGQPDPPSTLEQAWSAGLRVSFSNFIQYLLDPRTEEHEPFEPHWRQMHRLCHPCIIQYDYVGHQETLQEDARELLRLLRLDDAIQFPPSYQNVTKAESVEDWFRAIPSEDRRGLYKLYELDFKLFDYERPNKVLDG